MAGKAGKSGGKRPGAGRKSKASEIELQKLLKKCIKPADREKLFASLLTDAKSPAFSVRNDARKQLLAYLFGKPVDRDGFGEEDEPESSAEDTLTDWKQLREERRAQAESAFPEGGE